MATFSRRLFLGVLAGGLALNAGCGNFGSMAYFLMPEQRLEAKLRHLASTDEKKKPKIVIITHAPLDLDTDFLHADREIAENLGRHLKMLAEVYKDKLEIVSQRRVEEYKNTHQGTWRSKELTEIGEDLKADYVIYLDILSLSMKQPGNIGLLSGRANLNIQLCDVKNPDSSPPQESFTIQYPKESLGGTPIDNDSHPTQFRQVFLDRLARKLVPYFAKYPRSELNSME